MWTPTVNSPEEIIKSPKKIYWFGFPLSSFECALEAWTRANEIDVNNDSRAAIETFIPPIVSGRSSWRPATTAMTEISRWPWLTLKFMRHKKTHWNRATQQESTFISEEMMSEYSYRWHMQTTYSIGHTILASRTPKIHIHECICEMRVAHGLEGRMRPTKKKHHRMRTAF